MYQVIISRTAEKQLESLPKYIANTITQKIEALGGAPRPPGCKQLHGIENTYRLRVGDYRVVYTIQDKKLLIEVIRIGNRNNVYRKK